MNTILPTDRAALLARLAEPRQYDLAVVGGGATGLGVALDAALRGYSVVLVEAHDFAKGTSSRATKLVHGGVRYLAQGDIHLVREALHERVHILESAPHLAQPLPFVMPSYRLWETPFYGTGLKLYDLLAGRAGLGATEWLGARETLRELPGVQPRGLKGGVRYWDGQFDDARLALALARTAARQGALVLNYCEVVDVLHEAGRAVGLVVRDTEGGRAWRIAAGCIVNATGVWVDALRQQDARAAGRTVAPMVAPSQGVHLVVEQDFLPGDHALLVPSTRDGRVLFAVPWLGKLILGTTDTPRSDVPLEPRPQAAEVDFILAESARYLRRAPTRADIRSSWAGLRPLVRPDEDSGDTKAISREHTVRIARSGLVTVTGGKWTTYRAMAEDVLGHCVQAGQLAPRGPARSAGFRLVGAELAPGTHPVGLARPQGLHSYGAEAAAVAALPGADRWLAGGLSEAMVRFAVRHEYARTVEDVLARRARCLFLDAAEAGRLAAPVAAILAQELGRAVDTAGFEALARAYAEPGEAPVR
ncbi:MAG TPA: glycerol-3-phosphate dehydrogenase/oxidase [Ottowia sp.]|uniref:glycerol-3-phosphate dehydrogenase/oxidase n=1 Tax=Ottowia sp. TaxID=1898956 RepID=UPI002C54AD4F|nr:glycerol-3-phosphate dehydrogenase/oxidase [Ottowia sp.]HMN20023.1 glycerol-3-phosphate dehydrogenase/oxidase [Ottowia sp.]